MVSRTEAIARLTAEGTFEIVEDHAHGYPAARLPQCAAVVPRDRGALAPLWRAAVPDLWRGDAHLPGALRQGRLPGPSSCAPSGVEKGDRVAIGMRNYPEWMISFWACQAIGAVVRGDQRLVDRAGDRLRAGGFPARRAADRRRAAGAARAADRRDAGPEERRGGAPRRRGARRRRLRRGRPRRRRRPCRRPRSARPITPPSSTPPAPPASRRARSPPSATT